MQLQGFISCYLSNGMYIPAYQSQGFGIDEWSWNDYGILHLMEGLRIEFLNVVKGIGALGGIPMFKPACQFGTISHTSSTWIQFRGNLAILYQFCCTIPYDSLANSNSNSYSKIIYYMYIIINIPLSCTE